jgi:hypothetical protein
MLVLITLLSNAFATDLVWNWSQAEPVRYHLETLVETPRSHIWLSKGNDYARTIKNHVTMDVACTGSQAGKNWSVDCKIESVALHGVAVEGDEVVLEQIFASSVALLEQKEIRLSVAANGRIRKLDIVGVYADDSRMGEMIEGLRQMMRRVFAPMDLQLPKDGDDGGKEWKQKGSPLAMELLTAQGTSGGVIMKHRVLVGGDGDGVLYVTKGRGSVAEGANMEAGTTSFMRVSTEGRGEFNTAMGVLNWAEVRTKAKYSASAINALSGVGAYRYSGWVVRVRPDGTRVEIPAIKAQ